MEWLISLIQSHPGATDLHLTAGYPVFLRQEGRLAPSPVPSDACWDSLFALLSAEERARWERGGASDSSFSAGSFRCRLHLYRAGGAPAAAIRLLPALSALPPDRDQQWIEETAMAPAGLALITGPTGSGKSTTLARLIGTILLRRPCHIVTIEDPVEYLFSREGALVHQREVGRDTSSFASGIREALREDPDVIAIGELRDQETMSAALTASETGHLVLATMHTHRAIQAVSRITHTFPAEKEGEIRRILASVLLTISAQTLQRLPRPLLIREILVNTPAIAHLIQEGRDREILSYMEMGGGAMRTLRQDLTGAARREGLSPEIAAALRKSILS